MSQLLTNTTSLQEVLTALDGKAAGGNYIPIPEIAEVGQTIKVSAIDENGKPTAWEAVDFPSGGASEEMEVITYGVTTADGPITINKDKSGNAFTLSKFCFITFGDFTPKDGYCRYAVQEVDNTSDGWFELEKINDGLIIMSGEIGKPVELTVYRWGYFSLMKQVLKATSLRLTADENGIVNTTGIVDSNIKEFWAKQWMGAVNPAAGTQYILYGVRA